MVRAISFTVNASSFDRAAFSELMDAQRKAEKLRDDLIAAFKKSDRFLAARDLAKTSDYGGGKIEPLVSLTGGVFTVQISVDETDTTPAKVSRPQVHLDPKLTNILLHGNLLNHAEKRALVASLAPGVLSNVEGGAS